jgi:MoxR-like ATPase
MAAKIKAASEARASVIESDVCGVVHAALRHRLILNFEGQAENVSPDQLIDAVLDAVPRKS